MSPLGSEKLGSSVPDEPEFLSIGKIRRPHGIQGEMLMELYTDFPERITAGKKIYIGLKFTPQVISKVRSAGDKLLICFNQVKTPEEAGIYRNQVVFIRRDEVPPLAEGEYYHHQLVGCQVFDDNKNNLGRVVEIINTGANDVLVVLSEQGNELLVPIIESVIVQVNLPGKEITIKPQKWE